MRLWFIGSIIFKYYSCLFCKLVWNMVSENVEEGSLYVVSLIIDWFYVIDKYGGILNFFINLRKGKKK